MFWFFLIAVFGSIYLFDKMTRSYLNSYKLIMIFGKKGSGKTTYLTKTAIKEMKKGHVVYSTIYIPGTHMFNVDDIGSIIPGSCFINFLPSSPFFITFGAVMVF